MTYYMYSDDEKGKCNYNSNITSQRESGDEEVVQLTAQYEEVQYATNSEKCS